MIMDLLSKVRHHIQATLSATEENRLALAVQGRALLREIDHMPTVAQPAPKYDLRAFARFLYEHCALDPDKAGDVAATILSEYTVWPDDFAAQPPAALAKGALLWRVPRLVGDALSLSRWNYFDKEEDAGCEAQALGTDYEEVRIVCETAQPPAAPVETRTAPESCPNCFDESDCANVDICRAVEDVYAPAQCSAGSEPVASKCCDITASVLCAGCPRSTAPQDLERMRDVLVSAQRIIERDFPNGQLAIDIRNVLTATGPQGAWQSIETAPFVSAKRYLIVNASEIPVIGFRYYPDGPWYDEHGHSLNPLAWQELPSYSLPRPQREKITPGCTCRFPECHPCEYCEPSQDEG